MKKYQLLPFAAGGLMLLASGASHAVISGDLLTNSAVTTGWQNCEGSSLVDESATNFDPEHLNGSGCAYRETTAIAGETYKMSCGVSSLKYSSMTMSFLDSNGDSIAEKTTEILEDVDGSAYSVTLLAPAGTTTAAIGIYGLEGSGFQDCTLLLDNQESLPVNGSISGHAWFDENADGLKADSESKIVSTPVSIFQSGKLVAAMVTELDGSYYFGGLGIGQCYNLKFEPADPTLGYANIGGDNAIINGDGESLDICLSGVAPNVPDIDGGFVAITPIEPPQDYAVCGGMFHEGSDTIELLSDLEVILRNVVTDERLTVITGVAGAYSFNSLSAGDYELLFEQPSAYDFKEGSSDLTGSSSYADANGVSPQFNLPADSNTKENDACTLNNANAWFTSTPVTLDPTVATNDRVEGFVGDSLISSILTNDVACGAGVLEVDLLGHNVPGDVIYNEAKETIEISNTTESGRYDVRYGLRGECGSYDTAKLRVVIKDQPEEPVAGAPDAPYSCKTSIGRGTGTEGGVHVDLYMRPGNTTIEEHFASAYNFYDADMKLRFTGLRDAGEPLSATRKPWGINWKKSIHNVEVLGIAFVTAVENGIESPVTECVIRLVTPIALDINNDGHVNTISGNFSFDINGDGKDEQLTDWFSPTDGILIMSDFGDAISGEHLFGDTGGKFLDGFKKLAVQDLNNDGKLMAEELGELSIWTDKNSNQSVDDGELSSLESHSIASMSLDHYKFTARATLGNGKTLLMRDLWFGLHSIVQAAK